MIAKHVNATALRTIEDADQLRIVYFLRYRFGPSATAPTLDGDALHGARVAGDGDKTDDFVIHSFLPEIGSLPSSLSFLA